MFNKLVNLISFEAVYFGNSIGVYLTSIGAFLVFLLVFSITQLIIISRLKKLAKKTKTDIDDTLIKVVQKVRPPFYSFLAFYFATKFLTLYGFFQKALDIVLTIWIVYLVVASFQILVDYLANRYLKKEDATGTKGAVDLLSKIIKGVLWGLGLLFILSNLGVNVTSLVAGLGIGGIAVALALQSVLEDLFSSFSIYFDKPFVVGDFIIVGENMGTVKKIGIKTTRIRALQGEEVVISNKELTSVRIQNFKKMKERRVLFSLGVVYQTSSSKLKKVPGIIEKIVTSTKKARFDRCHFNKFDDSALSFEVVYYVLSGDYKGYMDINQEILFRIKDEFEKNKIEMAYPTQTIFVDKQ
jgi:small-conductance mechanosensitive channel